MQWFDYMLVDVENIAEVHSIGNKTDGDSTDGWTVVQPRKKTKQLPLSWSAVVTRTE